MGKLLSTTLATLGPGMHGDGDGLYLQVKGAGRSWVFRFKIAGRPRYAGLGRYPDVSLAKARAAAAERRATILKGVDPLIEAEQRRKAEALERARSVTFETAATEHIEANKAGWKNKKHAGQWTATLETYVYPTIGHLSVSAIDTGMVVKILTPIWSTKTETATRVRQRIETVMDSAKVKGYREGENPARWKGHLDHILPRARKVHKVQHFPAMPFEDVPKFMKTLAARNAVSARALRFTILTAARTTETRLATLGEIDRKAAIWTIPAGRMKREREHRVPLTKEALALLPHDGDADTILFPNDEGTALSDAAMRKYLQEDMGYPDLTVHGFRSSFKDWSGDCTNVAREIVEAALSHAVGDETEQAYRRSDAIERRRRLMQMWAKYCTSGAGASATDEKVVSIRRK